MKIKELIKVLEVLEYLGIKTARDFDGFGVYLDDSEFRIASMHVFKSTTVTPLTKKNIYEFIWSMPSKDFLINEFDLEQFIKDTN